MECNVSLSNVKSMSTVVPVSSLCSPQLHRMCPGCVCVTICTPTVILTSHLVAKLKAEATRIEMEAELTCQTKVSYSVYNPVLL